MSISKCLHNPIDTAEVDQVNNRGTEADGGLRGPSWRNQ